jgi:hypothetical protein
MSNKNPNIVPGNNGRTSHKRFARSLESRVKAAQKHLEHVKNILGKASSK